MWSNDSTELLKKLWAEGLSASQIAARLGGVTRNAVIGKASRLNLANRIDDIRARALAGKLAAQKRVRERAVRAAQRMVARIEKAAKPIKPAEEDVALLIAIPTNNFLSQRRGGCKWPHGELCQNDAVFKRPYCADHEAQSCG